MFFPRPEMVMDDIAGDPVDPAFDLPEVPKVVQILVHPEEDLLPQILRLRDVPRMASDEAEQPVAELPPDRFRRHQQHPAPTASGGQQSPQAPSATVRPFR